MNREGRLTVLVHRACQMSIIKVSSCSAFDIIPAMVYCAYVKWLEGRSWGGQGSV